MYTHLHKCDSHHLYCGKTSSWNNKVDTPKTSSVSVTSLTCKRIEKDKTRGDSVVKLYASYKQFTMFRHRK